MFGREINFSLSAEKKKITSQLGGFATIIFMLVIIYYTITNIVEVYTNSWTTFNSQNKLINFEK